MATSFDVNLTIGSSIGFRQVSGSIIGSFPTLQTTHTLDGVDYSPVDFSKSIKLLSVNTLDPFQIYPGGVSSTQSVHLTNLGNATLTVTNIIFTADGAIPIADILTPTITILPLTTATFHIAYTGDQVGEYSNSFTIISNNSAKNYKVLTTQQIGDYADISISPNVFTTATTSLGELAVQTYSIIPMVNGILFPDVPANFTASISGSSAWSIAEQGPNSLTMQFDSNAVSNIAGSYSTTLSIKSGGLVNDITNIATVNINTATNKNYGSWISPIAPHNSVIAMSYDLVNSVRVLTIGVGVGGNGVPIYDEDIVLYDSLLSQGASRGYLNRGEYWSTVYKIVLDSSEKEYYSANHISQTTDINYGQYFGNSVSYGSMFIVQNDGYGNLTIKMNQLSRLSEEESVNVTLDNLTRAFFYYSEADVTSRYTQLSTPVGDGSETPLFIGFNNQGGVETSLVAFPK